MTSRAITGFGAVLLFVVAIGATAACAASASFDAEQESVTIEATQTEQLSIFVEGGAWECETADFHSVNAERKTATQKFPTPASGGYTSSSITMEAIYDGCEVDLLGEIEVDMNECHYEFTANGAIGEGTRSGSFHIRCPGESRIEFDGGICVIKIGPQEVGGITYHNAGTGSERDVEVTVNSSGIVYTQHGAFCPGNGFKATKEFNNGIYTGAMTVKGTSVVGNPVGTWVT